MMMGGAEFLPPPLPFIRPRSPVWVGAVPPYPHFRSGPFQGKMTVKVSLKFKRLLPLQWYPTIVVLKSWVLSYGFTVVG